jgi:phosphatidylinositol alpha 1,6-mannosyltransferase
LNSPSAQADWGPLCAVQVPRVAFLPDTFHEVNGVAHTSRQLEAFAGRHQIPFLSVHCGPVNEVKTSGTTTIVQLRRGPFSFGLDAHLDYDPFLLRHTGRVLRHVKEFGAQLIHITGPGDMGMLGCYIAWRLKLPLVISWHTNLHEYAGRRLERLLSAFGKRLGRSAGAFAERLSMDILSWFYRKAKVILAPNQGLVEMLRDLTHRPVYLMQRGVDTGLFSPARRNRHDRTFRLGYVGRLTPEKDVRFLAELGRSLTTLGRTNFDFLIIGQGSESDWLREHVPNAILPGVLRGEQLAEAYANMDLFVFPSKTDTFGNVILEALSSGVPAVVTSHGGPRFLVHNGVTGYVAPSDWDFIRCVNGLMTDLDLHHQMREAARHYATGQSWDAVFEAVFRAYHSCLEPEASTLAALAPLGKSL